MIAKRTVFHVEGYCRTPPPTGPRRELVATVDTPEDAAEVLGRAEECGWEDVVIVSEEWPLAKKGYNRPKTKKTA